MHYRNPWATNGAPFVDLGSDVIPEREKFHRVDFYALPEPGYIQFGARYGNDPEQYVGGFAHRAASTNKWEIVGDGWIHRAAARYFANHRS